jgi:hypothetical protein
MPIRKNHLTRNEQAEYLAAAEQLQAQGLVAELPKDWQRQVQGVQIDISASSMIYVMAAGQILYASYVRITTEINNLVLADFEMVAPWDPNISPADEPYIFGPHRLNFDLEEVLNHRLLNIIRLKREGDRIEGWLLGTGMAPVPSIYKIGSPAPLTLQLFDSTGRVFERSATVPVDRSAKIPAWFRELESRPAKQQIEGRAANFPLQLPANGSQDSGLEESTRVGGIASHSATED